MTTVRGDSNPPRARLHACTGVRVLRIPPKNCFPNHFYPVFRLIRCSMVKSTFQPSCQAPLCYWRGVKYYCATVPTPELPAVLIMEYRMPIMVVGLQCQPNIRIHWRIHPAIKRKVEDSFVDGVNSGIELQFVYLMGLPMWWMGSKDYVQSTEIYLVGGLNENSPLNWSCGANKSISLQLIILRFGTFNTTECYTTVFESDDQVGIWNLEFLTPSYITHSFGLYSVLSYAPTDSFCWVASSWQ